MHLGILPSHVAPPHCKGGVPHLVWAEMALRSNATGVQPRHNSLEALWPPLPMRIKGLAKFVVSHVGRQVQEACPPPHCPHSHLSVQPALFTVLAVISINPPAQSMLVNLRTLLGYPPAHRQDMSFKRMPGLQNPWTAESPQYAQKFCYFGLGHRASRHRIKQHSWCSKWEYTPTTS